MSQENSNQKRRWLARILSVHTPKALWLAPALFSPILMSAVGETAWAQAPAATRSISDNGPAVDAAFVIGWLDYANQQAEAGDILGSSQAFAEALRGRKMLGVTNPAVESRLKTVEQVLLAKGLKPENIKAAVQSLADVKAPPQIAKTISPAASPLDRRDQVAALNQAASTAIQAGDRAKAAQLIAQVEQAGVPDQWMLPGQLTLTQVKAQLNGVSSAAGNQLVSTAGATAPTTPVITGPVTPGVFQPGNDLSSNQRASQVELAMPVLEPISPNAGGEELYRRGVQLLAQGNRDAAYEHFVRAWKFKDEMDPALKSQLSSKLSSMQAATSSRAEAVSPQMQMSDAELNTRQRMMSEITHEIAAAEANREAEPDLVAERLQTLRTRVSQAEMNGDARKQMLTIVDRAVTAHQFYMSQNRAAIDQNMKNRQVIADIALSQEERTRLDQQIASLVETYNDLMDKQDFMEAEQVAKQVGTLDPNSEIARLLITNARIARRSGEYEQNRNSKESAWVDAFNNVDEASIAMDDRFPYQFPDARTWGNLTATRKAAQLRESQQGMSAAEAKIWDQLKQPVLVDFKQRPLSEVLRTLGDMTGVMIHVDQNGLAKEGLTEDMPVTLSLPSQISLRSALNLLLNSQGLDFQVRDEVLKVTSRRDMGDASVQRVYSVKDLVIPIPNFVTDYNSGMAGALKNAYETVNGLAVRTGGNGFGGGIQLASATSMDPNSPALGQLNNFGGGNLPGAMGGGFGLGPSSPMGGMGGAPMGMMGPQGISGGAAMADFQTLIMLIEMTIDPDSWLNAGGTSSIQPYPANLSLVISAPQTTHEKITDLLDSLRRLQDLQVTIEVKFITLNDNFFERIGVDFDLRIDDNVRQLPNDDQGPSTVVGLSSNVSATNPFPLTADFDLALSQDSFSTVLPPFGGFTADAGASLGFAILSDLEMFFFMNAAQGDQRTNVLQAPRVTMFDGQTASITDQVQRPFVTSLIPVVADFAVAQQPVIVVLNEGTVLNVGAVVSPDKRFVRLTLNPSFSQIDRVDTFTFEGSRTTRTNSSRSGNNILDAAGNITNNDSDSEAIISGTTVQQPSFAITSVSTTVSVPDGGTILLGGIKRMREGRLERGVPILSKIPYVNRLFKNTAIGRETSTLMMTVTPRIIIQEEEEEKYGVNP